jgi:predicted secreted protein
MQTSTVIAIYFLIWWITLFAVLPFGVKSQHEGGGFAEGTDPGAPVMARVWPKLMWTTIVASAIFGVLFLVYRYRLIDFDAVLGLVRLPR